jgi:vitamin K-dependent gamma-carboxylase
VIDRLRARLARPVDATGLAAFRALFGALLVVGTIRFAARGWIAAMYVEPEFHFHYWGFGWVRPWPGVGMYVHFAALTIAALCLTLGLRPRLAALACFVLFTYVELLDKAAYLNHYYFVSVVLLLLCVLPTDPRRAAPTWALYAVRLQVGLVYGFAGIAKLRGDWLLRGQPLKTWLAAHGDFPLLGPLFLRPETALVMSWAGAAFDLCVPLLLLHRRTRPWAFAALLGFHALTGALFPIGMFPWLMSASALIFFPPDWPRRLAARLGLASSATTGSESTPVPRDRTSRWLVWALGLHFAAQLLLPLRRHLYPGDHAWTEQGYRYAWHVMLVEKSGVVTYRVRDPASGREFRVHPEDTLTAQQAKQMAIAPDMILEYAHHLAAEFATRGLPGVEVRVDAFVAYNGRPGARLIDPDVDLARSRDGLAPYPWVLPAP